MNDHADIAFDHAMDCHLRTAAPELDDVALFHRFNPIEDQPRPPSRLTVTTAVANFNAHIGGRFSIEPEQVVAIGRLSRSALQLGRQQRQGCRCARSPS